MTGEAHPNQMPDTEKTWFVAQAMHQAFRDSVATDVASSSRQVSMEIAGAMAWLSASIDLDDASDLKAREQIAYQIAPHLLREKRALLRHAEVDSFTGLGNKEALYKALPSANSHPNIRVLMFDADNFGKINKKLGWNKGDQVIIELAAHIKKTAEKYGCGERVFRFGEKADEFVVLARLSIADELLDAIITGYGFQQHGPVTISLTGASGYNHEEAVENLKRKKAVKKQKNVITRIGKAIFDELV